MPQRFLKPGITHSERWNSVSPLAANFYVRLITVVDDYGRCDGRESILHGLWAIYNELHAACPVTIRQVREQIQELAEVNLIELYEVSGKKVIQITQWSERIRTGTRQKWPANPNRTPAAESCGILQLPAESCGSQKTDLQESAANSCNFLRNTATSCGFLPPTSPSPSPSPPTPSPCGGEGGTVVSGISLTQRPAPQDCEAGETKPDGHITFTPIRPGLFPREYQAMLDAAQAEIEAIKASDDSYTRHLTSEARDLIAMLEAEGKADRAAEVLKRQDSHKRGKMTASASNALQSWRKRASDIKAAMNGVLPGGRT